ncbi:hypothetical protein [Wolbachia endosymbiont (group A) of Pipizella viduata]|uniref:hypothetical protein n=1 Tax=Wolbachia endosymbiont (group A) of Pipizella viduata TaxID=3066154 RepID=UPI0033418871
MRKLWKIIRAIKGVSIGRFSDTLFCEPELYQAVSNCDVDKVKSLIENVLISTNAAVMAIHLYTRLSCWKIYLL